MQWMTGRKRPWKKELSTAGSLFCFSLGTQERQPLRLPDERRPLEAYRRRQAQSQQLLHQHQHQHPQRKEAEQTAGEEEEEEEEEEQEEEEEEEEFSSTVW